MSQPQSITPVPGSPGAVLVAAQAARRAEEAAAAALLAAAVEWAAMHEPTGGGNAAYWWEAGQPIPLAGEGAPEIAEYAVAEFAAAVGLTTDAGRRLVGQALELSWRLPTLWEQVQEGRLPSWRARRVADATISLSRPAARFVDRQVAAVAGRVSVPQLDRLVQEAKIRFEAVERPDPTDACPSVPDPRHVRVHTDEVSFDGTVPVTGELDLADALHLDRALAAAAEQLKVAGSGDTLDVRRAMALGELARRDLTLTFDGTTLKEARSAVSGPHRPVTLYLHLSEQALAGGSPLGRCENTRSPVSVDAIRTWCGHPDAIVTVKPVVDLTAHVRVDQYELPDRLRETIDQRDGHCVFPWCTRPARRCDHDHAIAYDAGGPSCSCNVAPLCRHHHRLKTHTPWRYKIPEPGVHVWTSPHGYDFLVDSTGSRDVTPAQAATAPGCPAEHPPPE